MEKSLPIGQSKLDGSAWEYVEEFDEYYLHLFHKLKQISTGIIPK